MLVIPGKAHFTDAASRGRINSLGLRVRQAGVLVIRTPRREGFCGTYCKEETHAGASLFCTTAERGKREGGLTAAKTISFRRTKFVKEETVNSNIFFENLKLFMLILIYKTKCVC